MADQGDREPQRRVRRRQRQMAEVREDYGYNISISALGTSHRAGAIEQATQLFPAAHLHMAREWIVRCPILFAALQFLGLHMLCFIQHINVDINMIMSMVERWCPATNSFHLPTGEMTMTLQDVQVILGLRIDGEPLISERVVGAGLRWGTWKDCCMELLGRCPNPEEEFRNPENNNNVVKFTMGSTAQQSIMPLRWLRWVFQRESYANLEEHVFNYHLRAYCLYMIGCLLLPDTSGSHVPMQYLPLLEDFQKFSQISIGGAVLAHLYRELYMATNPTRVYIAGCLPLLQVWCWERFKFFRPTRSPAALQDLITKPLAARWANKTTRDPPAGNISTYRNALDGLRHDKVIMTPYKEDVLQILNPACRDSQEICTARVPLISFKRVEWHMPDRVMRQFGGIQPTNVLPLDRNFQRTDGRGRTDVDWLNFHHNHIILWLARRDSITPIIRPNGDGRVELSSYLTWYTSWASLFLSNPSSRAPTTSDDMCTNDRDVIDYVIRSRDIARRFSGHHGQSQSSMQQGFDEILELSSRFEDSIFINYAMSSTQRAHEGINPHRRPTYETSLRSSATLPQNIALEPPRQSMFAVSSEQALPTIFETGQPSQDWRQVQAEICMEALQQQSLYMHDSNLNRAPTMHVREMMSPTCTPSNQSQNAVQPQQSNDEIQADRRERRPPKRYTPGSGALRGRKKT